MGPKKNQDKERELLEDGEAVDLEREVSELRNRLHSVESDNCRLEQENVALVERQKRQEEERQASPPEWPSLAAGDQLERAETSHQSMPRFEARRSPNSGRPWSYVPYPGENHTANRYDVPLPSQLLFDGTCAWDSFVRPFNSLAESCGWSERERVFRLKSSLRGEAAEYAFTQLSEDSLGSYRFLVTALEARFKDRRTSSSHLNELEHRRWEPKEKIAEYVADIKRLVIRGYPTADEVTRNTIGLRYFLRGLPDQQMAIAVGMQNSANIDQAMEALGTYVSLKDEMSRSHKVRMVQTPAQDQSAAFVTEARLKEFGSELMKSLDAKFDKLETMITKSANKGSDRNQRQHQRTDGRRQRNAANVECYNCHELGHYANDCPQQRRSNGDASEVSEN